MADWTFWAVELTLFGDLSARIEARSLGRGKPVALLAYLSASPGRRASRERLATLLWSEGSSEQARQNLRQTLWYLKRRLGDCVLATDDFVEVDPRVSSDRERFLTAVREQRLAEAVALYRGPFIPEFAAPGAAAFEEWVDVERRRLRALFVGCCDTLVRQSLSVGQAATAVDLARRARDEAPSELGAWRLLLESLSASHDVVSALAEAEHLEAYLASEDLQPDDATRAALRAARSSANATASSTLGRDAASAREDDASALLAPELIGRETEFRALLECWEHTREGRGSAVLVTGVAGLGKSRLLGDLYRRLRASRARALLLRANPGDRAVAGGFVAALAEALAQRPGAAAISGESAGVLVALAPALASNYPRARPDAAVGDDATRRRVGALLDLLRAVSDEHPLALLVDDIHWADSESRRVLDAVAARLEAGRALLVLAARPPLETLGGFAALPRFELRTFDLARTAEFVTRLGSLPPEPWAAELPPQLLTATRGIPLTLIEALQRLLEAGSLELREGEWTCSDPSQVQALLQQGMVLEARVRSLSNAARALLLRLATLGRPAEFAVADALAGGLVELEHRGFVSRHGDRLHVVHDEFAQAALDVASLAERRAEQEFAAEHLLARPDSESALRLALAHAAQAENPRLLQRAALAWVSQRRREGDGRSAEALLRDGFGDAASPGVLRRVLAGVPWTKRVARPLVRAAAALLLLAGSTATALALRGSTPPELEVVLLTQEETPRLLRVVVQDLDRWRTDVPLEAKEIPRSRLPRGMQDLPRALVQRMPDGNGWYGWGFVPAEGNDEALLLTSDGTLTLPVADEGDDAATSASPDGRYLLVASARWHRATDRYNIGVLDLQSGEFRRLLASDEFDTSPRWSPDGTRIAFQRTPFTTEAPYQVCVMTADGRDLRCSWPDTQDHLTLLSWIDDRQLLVRHPFSEVVSSLDTETGALQRLGPLALADATADGQVIVARTRAERDGIETAALVRVGDRLSLRPILLNGRPIIGRAILTAGRLPRRFVHRVELAVPSSGVPVDQTHALRAVAYDSSGATVRVHAARFRSLQDSIAVVQDGILRPRRLGRVPVEVTLGGWRTDTGYIEIVPSTYRGLLRELWFEGWEERWRKFGVPAPFVRPPADEAGGTLHPNGDGSYRSGVYLRESLEGRRGIGLELELALPLTSLMQWQQLQLSLIAMPSRRVLEDWDHVTGDAPYIERSVCATVFGGEGGPSRLTLQLLAWDRIGDQAPTPTGLYEGGWKTVRLQLFPDGRCGIAIDGAPVMLTRAPNPITDPLLLLISGHSVQTNIRLRRLEIWEGVRGEVEWAVLEQRQPVTEITQPGTVVQRPPDGA